MPEQQESRPVAPVVPIVSARKGLLRGDDIEKIPDPSPLIEGVLDLDSTATLYGESGAGKSFVALDWALCVATGQPWCDHAVAAPGNVLYVVGEGLSGTRSRFIAWKRHHRRPTVPNIGWGAYAPSILHPQSRDELFGWIDETEPVFVILDTLARHIPGVDENTFETMSRAVEVMDQVRLRTGGCAMVVHHTGKELGRGARGHSSLKGAMDTEIEVLKDTKGLKLVVRKQKNHEDGHTLGSLKWKYVGQSLVLVPAGTATKNQDLALGVLAAADTPLDFVTWRDRSVASGVPLGSFDRVRRALVEKAIVVTDTTDTDTGKDWYRLP